METEMLLSLCVGIGLSAACGFRVFVPLLVMSIASYSGHLTLAQGFQWIGTPTALAAFSIATVFEITAYYVPWLDNLLDSIATPAAVVAGTIVTAAMVTDMSPFLKWTLAAIAGGGAAAVVQSSTVLVRGISTVATGGLANPIIATAELGGSLFASALAVMMPPVAVLLFAMVLIVAGRAVMRNRASKLALSPPRLA